MMKLGLALLAIGAAATRISAGDACFGSWWYDATCDAYYQEDLCTDACIWWGSNDTDFDFDDDWWLTCDDFWAGIC